MVLFDSVFVLLFVIINVSFRNWLGWDRLWVQDISEMSIILAVTLGILYVLIDVIHLFYKTKLFSVLKIITFTLIILVLVGFPLYSSIIARHTSVAYLLIHDGALQTEIATRFLFQGKDPYAATFFNTPMQYWQYHDPLHPKAINPALYHYIYLPFYLLTGAAGQLIQKVTLHWEDLRITLFAEYLVMIGVVWALVYKLKNKYLYLSLFAINPIVVHFLLEGRGDVAAFFYLLVSAFFLWRKNIILSALFLGFSVAFRQTLWLAVPFFLCFVFFETNIQKNAKKFTIVFVLTSLILILPFFLWNPAAFIDSTIGYPNGTAPHSYPITSIGFGELLLLLKVIPDSRNYFPFWIFQVVFCAPLFLFFLYKLMKKPRISYLFLFFSVTSLVFLYFSRMFSDSYVVIVLLSLISGIMFYELEEGDKKVSKR